MKAITCRAWVLALTLLFISPLLSPSLNATPETPINDSTPYSDRAHESATFGTYTPRGPIMIDGDGAFNASNGVVSGNGTPSNPYIISGWEFNTSNQDTQIYIIKTTAPFIIRDCYIHNSNLSIAPIGVYLQDTSNGVVENNTICGNYYRGIYCISKVGLTYNNTISHNSIYNNYVGIWLHSQRYQATVQGNYITDNHVFNNTNQGIVLGTNYRNFIRNNSVESNGQYGIIIHSVNQDEVSYNKIVNNKGGIEVDSASMFNKIYRNDIINDKGAGYEQATDATKNNYWSYLNLGNYWSDYTSLYPYAYPDGLVWNHSYAVPGAGGAIDQYPLVMPNTPAPFAPTIVGPAVNARTTGNNVNLTWMPRYSPVLTNYNVYFGTDNPPMTIVATKPSAVSYHHVFTSDGVKYYWRVRATNVYGNTNSTLGTFIENTKPPAVSVPITPHDGTINITYGLGQVSWTNVSDADGDSLMYYWYADNESSVSVPYVANGTTTANQSGSFPTLPNATYYWRVKAFDGYEWSNWSNNGTSWSFTTSNIKQDFLPVVQVVSPNGGEFWYKGEIHKITWTATDDKALPANCINISYSTDYGTGWMPIASNTVNNGTYAWIIPSTINSTQCLVKVECRDSANHTVNDTSNATFAISNYKVPDNPPTVALLSPNGDEVWNQNTIHLVRWFATDDRALPPDCINISYSTDDGAGWTTMGMNLPNNGTCAWLVPDDINSTLCLVRVECADTALQTGNDTSNATFTITNYTVPDMPPEVRVVSPDGGEVWDQDTIHMIKWNATDDKPLSSTCINLSYSENNGTTWTVIGYKQKNNGTMAWLVPNTVNSTQCLVKVECTDAALQTAYDLSNATFTIREVVTATDNPPEVYVLAPLMFDTLYGGDNYSVRWNATDDRPLPAHCVNVSYTTDNGANWTDIAVEHNNTGSAAWLVPRNDTPDARVRVTVFDSRGQAVEAVSGKFTIEKWNKSADFAPVITSTPSKNATVGKEWTYNMSVTDPDVAWGDRLAFSLDKSPAGMDINETSGRVRWTPDTEGNFTVTVVVTYSQGKSVNQTFTLTVAAGPEENISLDFAVLMLGVFVVAIVILCLVLVLFALKKRKRDIKTVKGKDDDDEQTSQKVIDDVVAHPDDDFESISIRLGMDARTLNDKLNYFIGSGMIEERKDGKYRRYTAIKPLKTGDKASTKEITPKAAKAAPKLSGDAKSIITYLSEYPDSTVESIAKGTLIDQPVAYIIVGELKESGDVEEKADGATLKYSIARPRSRKDVPKPRIITPKTAVGETPASGAEPKVAAQSPRDIGTGPAEAPAKVPEAPPVEKPLAVPVTTPPVPSSAKESNDESVMTEQEAEDDEKASMSSVAVPTDDKEEDSISVKIRKHLVRYSNQRSLGTLSPDVTQTGIAKKIGVERPKVATVLKRMEKRKEIQVDEDRHVRGARRVLNAYFLTPIGEQLAKEDLEKDGVQK